MRRQQRRSARSLRYIFEELRFNYDVCGTVTQRDLALFAQLSGCSDLIEEAWLTSGEYQRRVEAAGGRYPVDALRKSFAEYHGTRGFV